MCKVTPAIRRYPLARSGEPSRESASLGGVAGAASDREYPEIAEAPVRRRKCVHRVQRMRVCEARRDEARRDETGRDETR